MQQRKEKKMGTEKRIVIEQGDEYFVCIDSVDYGKFIRTICKNCVNGFREFPANLIFQEDPIDIICIEEILRVTELTCSWVFSKTKGHFLTGCGKQYMLLYKECPNCSGKTVEIKEQ